MLIYYTKQPAIKSHKSQRQTSSRARDSGTKTDKREAGALLMNKCTLRRNLCWLAIYYNKNSSTHTNTHTTTSREDTQIQRYTNQTHPADEIVCCGCVSVCVCGEEYIIICTFVDMSRNKAFARQQHMKKKNNNVYTL